MTAVGKLLALRPCLRRLQRAVYEEHVIHYMTPLFDRTHEARADCALSDPKRDPARRLPLPSLPHLFRAPIVHTLTLHFPRAVQNLRTLISEMTHGESVTLVHLLRAAKASGGNLAAVVSSAVSPGALDASQRASPSFHRAACACPRRDGETCDSGAPSRYFRRTRCRHRSGRSAAWLQTWSSAMLGRMSWRCFARSISTPWATWSTGARRCVRKAPLGVRARSSHGAATVSGVSCCYLLLCPADFSARL